MWKNIHFFTESFIWKVLRNVGRHSVDVKSLKAADLDKLAVLIADALQVVEQQAGQGETPRDLETQQSPEDETEDMQYEDQRPESYAVDQTPEDRAQNQREEDEESSSVTQKTVQTNPPVTGNIFWNKDSHSYVEKHL